MYLDVGYIRYESEEDRWVWEQRRERRQRKQSQHLKHEIPTSDYEVVVSGTPFPLELPEFHLIRILASRPYHAFASRDLIAGLAQVGVAIEGESALRDIVVSLRGKLGFFRDFVQTVPYIGYRFRP